ncbi:F-box protein SKIP31 isoform X2 [Malania oleifera]|uniref:F-box protein SKIP31 isoform X2 n=1 Tax=Malania oleifera TaxID=397392 RepID=UPI0025AEB16D|nr:F-box protein SKIP31 isoform X2 [Malania oleifera]XP_057963785.1 F-box protein SKIP31 isoform X2 [Malania oleifera]XP_057963787.1 F-box protein SKIP31 isoform X2 [Malania oleifera]XP_057963788.1 F-box protein SKIP31 isoform X2 [Malania oleifera]XP_057963789.1 F-box protein SKIP31 isoform X2 [Malania oleifera]XP_057963790.1 F-box protein SKIP31 isoform X2 [Malania oleifera]XP_057963791.1 F-box protein SKIP31 isoform X2 [Malania oleifera]
MTLSDDEDEILAQFLESEVLSEASDHQDDDGGGGGGDDREQGEAKLDPPQAKRPRVTDNQDYSDGSSSSLAFTGLNSKSIPKRIESGIFSKIPADLFHNILKFLSSEDLIACSLVCRFLNYAASDEALWRRLYCMRWGLLPLTKKLREVAWKKLYIERDEEDMIEFVRNCPLEFKEYYIQMQAAKRSQAPLPSQVNDDKIILDKTVADQVSIWKKSKGLTDKVVVDHACSGETCSYYQIGDVFVCEKTGQVHVCDDTCREVILDPTNELLVCTISGHCFDRLLSPAEMEPDAEQQQIGATDEAEPFMGSGRFARAYLLGYNCADEKELEAALRFC